MLNLVLALVFLAILLAPPLVRRVEHDIEIFLFVMGVAAVTASHFLGTEPLWGAGLLITALEEPVKITLATLIFGLAFRAARKPLRKKIVTVERFMGPRAFAFFLILTLGLLSSVITAIVAALVLCEIISALTLDKKYETTVAILACFSIGMGAALTPVGEPLSTIAVARLKGGHHSADFLFLIRMIGIYVIPGILIVSALGALLRGKEVGRYDSIEEDFPEPVRFTLMRSLRVYVFVMALILLGAGFKPFIDAYILKMPASALYWANMSSAVLDNATLAAAELSPSMDAGQIKGILMGLIIAGGMLIPGNIPNIISASKLNISSRAWAVIGAPVGLALMVGYYVVLYILS